MKYRKSYHFQWLSRYVLIFWQQVVSIEDMHIILPCPVPPTLNLLNTRVLPVLLLLMRRSLVRPALVSDVLPRSTVRLGQRAPSALTPSPDSTPGIPAWAQPHSTLWQSQAFAPPCFGESSLQRQRLHRCSEREGSADLRREWKLPLLCQVPLHVPGGTRAQHSLVSRSCGCAQLTAPPWLSPAALSQMDVGV